MKTVVCIAAYKERDNLEKLIPLVLDATGADVLVIDDNSPDGTPDFLREFATHEPRLIPLIRPEKQGYGTAVLAGFRGALDHGADVVVTMDADFSHDPADVAALVAAVTRDNETPCVAIGSRYVHGIRVMNWAKSRLLLSLCANFYVKTILGLDVEDATSGFRAYSRAAIDTVLAHSPTSRGYSFLSEILYTLHCRRTRIEEVPIIYTERREGQSKMSNGVIAEAIFRPWLLRIRSLAG